MGSRNRVDRAVIEALEGRSLFAAVGLSAVVATPPAATVNAAAAATADVKFSAVRGFYAAAFDLTLTSETPGATIRYTTDGSAPAAAGGAVYGGPLRVTTTTVVRAIAVGPGLTPSAVKTHTYLFLADVVKQKRTVAGYPNPTVLDGNYPSQTLDYEMDPKVVNDPAYAAGLLKGLKAIPSMMISVPKDKIFGPGGFYQTKDVEVGVSFEYFDPANPDDSVQQDAGVEGHADATPKRSLRVKFKKIYGKGSLDSRLLQHAPVGGVTATNDIDSLVLRAGNNRAWATGTGSTVKTTFTEDEFARQQQIAMTGQGVHGQFVHLYVNGLYFGLYNAAERPDEGYGAAYYGGEKDDWFAINHDNTTKNGDRTRWDAMVKTVAPKDMSNAANYAEMKTYLDVDQFADYMVGQSYAGVSDWPNNNWWAGGDTAKKQPFKFFVWDAEHQFNGQSGDITEIPYGAWLHPKLRPGDTGSPTVAPIVLWRSLVKSPEFRLLLADKIVKAVGPAGALSDAESLKRFDTLNDYVRDAVIGESARWGDAVAGRGLRTRDGNWAPAVKAIRDLIPGNGNKLIAAFRKYGYFPKLNSVTPGIPAGLFDPGVKLTLNRNNDSGTVYYTLDGTDPRLPGGGISPTAKIYYGPVTLIDSANLVTRVRALDGSEWSAATVATYTARAVDPRNLRVTELMYHPVDAAAGDVDADEFEFIEFKNTGTATLKLKDFVVGGGVDFTFGDVRLEPGQYGVIVKNQAAFVSRYNNDIRVLGTYSGKLDNAGERLVVTAPGDVTVSDFTYSDDWHPTTDGDGYSLVVANPAGDVNALNAASGWTPGRVVNGTPGRDEPGVTTNLKPVADAGADTSVTLPGTVVLNGRVYDDTIPAGGALTSRWTLVSGPGSVTFADATKAATAATFGAAGTYVLRLTASDGELSASDDVTVVVRPAVTPPPTPTNKAPLVNAGVDQTLTLPAGVTLNGTATDDALPAPAKLTVAWTLVSGPGAVVFADATKAVTTAAFGAAGTYVLRLSANDGALSASDDVTIVVRPRTTPTTNTAPQVNAGVDQTLTLPATTATLGGTVSDDGLPLGKNLTVAWSLVSGPGKVTFASLTSARTTVAFAAAGTYVLRLTASDSALTGGDEITVTVKPAPGTARLSGYVFTDKNANAKFDGTDTKDANVIVYLDANNDGKRTAGETFVTTGTGGAWAFGDLPAGLYRVRRDLAAGTTYSTQPLDVSLTNGLSVSNLAIGTKSGTPPALGSISGTLFWDENRNGRQDSGEVVQGGKTVFLDLDGDNVLDKNEPSVVSDANGNYTFKNLAAGTYKVRRTLTSGLVVTTPNANVTLTAGGSVTGVKIGTITK